MCFRCLGAEHATVALVTPTSCAASAAAAAAAAAAATTATAPQPQPQRSQKHRKLAPSFSFPNKDNEDRTVSWIKTTT